MKNLLYVKTYTIYNHRIIIFILTDTAMLLDKQSQFALHCVVVDRFIPEKTVPGPKAE